jgi:hypothetical protein
MAKILYYFLLVLTALLLYNWFFIPGKIMSNGQSEKAGFGIITLVSCILSAVIGYLYYSGNQRGGNILVYTVFGIGLIGLVYIISTVRWN